MDFDKHIERSGTFSAKWDRFPEPGNLPMWVADMDFAAAPCIQEAINKRAMHGIFGYTAVPESYYSAIIEWYARRYDTQIEADWVVPVTGVVPALSAIVGALSESGDGVIVQSPVYHCFFSSIKNMGREVLENKLVNVDGRYEIDFDAFEQLASQARTKLFVLCHPHNPVGRIWSEDELVRLGEICLRHGVVVVSDEIHCDLVFNGSRHVPFSTIRPEFLANSVTCQSPSKTFNIAGLQVANIIVADSTLRNKVAAAVARHEIGSINPFGVDALIAAYQQGDVWLEELKDYLWQNYLYTRDFLEKNLPNVTVTPLEATYLVWVDCRRLGLDCSELDARLKVQGVILNMGNMYGDSGDGFIRVNVACPKSLLVDGLNRIHVALSGLA